MYFHSTNKWMDGWIIRLLGSMYKIVVVRDCIGVIRRTAGCKQGELNSNDLPFCAR